MNDMAAEARKRLLDRKKAILQLLGEEEQHERQLEGAEPDVLDRASNRESIGLIETVRETHLRELRELDLALERIAHGTYGTCEMCGGAVGRQRLRAIPEARYCIECVSSRTRLAATA